MLAVFGFVNKCAKCAHVVYYLCRYEFSRFRLAPVYIYKKNILLSIYNCFVNVYLFKMFILCRGCFFYAFLCYACV